jgi:hypothetical protein
VEGPAVLSPVSEYSRDFLAPEVHQHAVWEVHIDPNVGEELVVTGVVWNSFRDNGKSKTRPLGKDQVIRCRNASVPCKHLEGWPRTYQHRRKRGR